MSNNFVALNQVLAQVSAPAGCSPDFWVRDWLPSLSDPHPPGVSGPSSTGFLLLHALHLFSTSDYYAVAIDLGDRNVHRSVVFPKDPRIGFMDSTDLQVGNIYTDPTFRRQGLALAALNRIREKFPGRRLWFFADPHNLPSLKLAKAAGFHVAGITTVSRFMGFGLRYGKLMPAPTAMLTAIDAP